MYRDWYITNIIHTHTFNSLFKGTTRVGWYQKGKTNLDFTEARDSEWQWHQLGHMQVCTLLQTDNHVSTSPLYRLGALPATQPTASKHWRQYYWHYMCILISACYWKLFNNLYTVLVLCLRMAGPPAKIDIIVIAATFMPCRQALCKNPLNRLYD